MRKNISETKTNHFESAINFSDNLDQLNSRVTSSSATYLNKTISKTKNSGTATNLNSQKTINKSNLQSTPTPFGKSPILLPNYYNYCKDKPTTKSYALSHFAIPSKTEKIFNTSKIYSDFLCTCRKKTGVIDVISKRDVKSSSVNTQRVNSAGDGGKFPFKSTPSGNLKINSEQVVFESKKLSVLVANPKTTKIDIETRHSSIERMEGKQLGSGEYSKHSIIHSIISQQSSVVGNAPDRMENSNDVYSEYDGKATSDILKPERYLHQLGYNQNDSIDWSKVELPDKKNLYTELAKRIGNKENTDCVVMIDDQEFNCHFLVLQCYSNLFDNKAAVKKVQISSEDCSPASFQFIYDWMISDNRSYIALNRDNVLDIFVSAKYLGVADLIEQCWVFIDKEDIFSEDTAFLLYRDAKNRNLQEVKDLMFPRIRRFFLLLVASQDWVDLDFEDVKNLLSSNYICVNNETEIFMSAVRWLRYDWDNRKQYKREVLKCVRFGNIDSWQLVDIKKNQDNSEFMELTQDPEIYKLIDDGIAIGIINYWHNEQGDDYEHWISVLNLKVPLPRNWSGVHKNHFTYREFLVYLDQHRRNNIKNKSHQLSDKNIEARLSEIIGLEDRESVTSNKEYLVYSLSIESSKIKTGDEIYNVPSETTSILGTKQKNIKEEPKIPEQKVKKFKTISQLFTPSENHLAYVNRNHLSHSIFGAQHKDYFKETTLFFPEREAVLVFGGLDPLKKFGVGKNTGKEIYRYLPDSNIWEHAGELPEPRHHHCVEFMKGRVYLVGGADPRDDDIRGKSVVVDTVWSFEPVQRSWFSEVGLNVPRRNFGLVVYNHCLYAIGGQDRQLRTLKSVERFTITGGWTKLASLLKPRIGMAYVQYRGQIWVAGGLSPTKQDKNALLDSVEIYNISSNQWTEVAKINNPRCFCSMFVMTDNLYILGGAGELSDNEKATCSIKNIDLWDINELCWKELSELTIPRHAHAVTYLGPQLFIIGGVTTVYMRTLNNVECFCTHRGTWIRGVDSLPVPLSGHAATTLPPAYLMSI